MGPNIQCTAQTQTQTQGQTPQTATTPKTQNTTATTAVVSGGLLTNNNTKLNATLLCNLQLPLPPVLSTPTATAGNWNC
jgi:hypothetical protein